MIFILTVVRVRAEEQNLQLIKHATQEIEDDFTWFGKTDYVHDEINESHLDSLWSLGLQIISYI